MGLGDAKEIAVAAVYKLEQENVRLRKVMAAAANLEMVHNDGQLNNALKEYYNPELYSGK